MFTKGKIAAWWPLSHTICGYIFIPKKKKLIFFFFILFSPHDIEFFRESEMRTKREREIFSRNNFIPVYENQLVSSKGVTTSNNNIFVRSGEITLDTHA